MAIQVTAFIAPPLNSNVNCHDRGRFSNPIAKQLMPKFPAPNNALLNAICEFADVEPPNTYRVRLACELSYQDRPIPGLLKIDQYCFDATVDMIESGERLQKNIEKWKEKMRNSISVNIHHAKCVRWKELVHYVQLMPSKWHNGIACPEREYEEMRTFIRSIPVYQLAP